MQENQLDLRKGFGKFDDYELYKFPDESIKFVYKGISKDFIDLHVTLRSNDDLIALGLITNTLSHLGFKDIVCKIYYMMYQQDDRRLGDEQSFGLSIISSILNSYPITKFEVFHPHSDKIEFLRSCKILTNDKFIEHVIKELGDGNKDLCWVIPDSGAFKTQFKQIEKLGWKNFIVCAKSRNSETGDIEQVVNIGDLKGQDCVIFDDICLGGRTFIGIVDILNKHNCGKKYLGVSHGVFNQGVDHLLEIFDGIFTTNSICQLPSSEKLNIYEI